MYVSWQQQLADELHKPVKRNFTRRRIIVNGIDKIWCSDLAEMQQFSKWNKDYRYLLMVSDLFFKYGWIVPLKDKKGGTATEAFKTIFKEGCKPQYLWADKGKEYFNKHMEELLEKNGVTLYSTENDEKIVFVQDGTVPSKPRCGSSLLSRPRLFKRWIALSTG